MNKYEEYISRVKQIEKLNKEVQRLREEILEDVVSKEGRVENKFGMFLQVVNTAWTYSPSILKKEEVAKRKIQKISDELKLLKIKAQKHGKAKGVSYNTLRFVPKKK